MAAFNVLQHVPGFRVLPDGMAALPGQIRHGFNLQLRPLA
jgi:hypothetical protein